MAKVKEVIEEVISNIKVELLEIRKGVDYIAHKFGMTKFEDGVAEVNVEVATELKACGLVK